MRRLLIPLVCLISINTRGQALIRGFIFDSTRQKISAYQPIGGFYNLLFPDPASATLLRQDHTFTWTIKLDQPTMVAIRIGVEPLWFALEPHDTLDITINANQLRAGSPWKGLFIKGSNARGNLLINQRAFQPGPTIGHFESILDSLQFSKSRDFRIIDFALSQIAAPFDSLLRLGEIDRSFYEMVVEDLQGVAVSELCRHYLHVTNRPRDSMLTLVGRLYTRYPVSENMMRAGRSSGEIAGIYYQARASEAYIGRSLPDSLLRINGKRYRILRDLVPWLFAKEPIREYQWLINLCTYKNLDPDIITRQDAEAWLSFYPGSPEAMYLHPPYYPKDLRLDTPLDKAYCPFLDSTKYRSFESLTRAFPGKKLYIDFWATWCSPCKMQFAYNGAVDNFCAQHDIERLYISFDKPPTDIRVREDAYSYGLKGWHIVANRELVQDILRLFYAGRTMYAIPHYVLVNEQGKIVDADAPRPDTGNTLFDKMAAVFRFQR